MGKYGTNLEGFGAFEGGVNADKGAPLVSTSSDGETALIFGSAALRTIQAGVENGDFAIPPDAAGDTITEENPLPYWTFTDVNSAGAITCAVVADSGSGSGNALRWSIAASTTTGKSAKISRFIPILAARKSPFAYEPSVVTFSATATLTITLTMTMQYYKVDGVTTTGGLTTVGPTTFTALGIDPITTNIAPNAAPTDAAFMYLSVIISTAGTTPASVSSVDISAIQVSRGGPKLLVAESGILYTEPTTLVQSGGNLFITPRLGLGYVQIESALNTTGLLSPLAGAAVTGDITATGDIGFDGALYGTSALTGPNINLAGTNTRLWAHSASAADVAASTSTTISGVLITKVTAGQPSTNINGVATTDAFADALRNGGIAVDTTNNRAYFYSGGWKYAALTTPSDSRLKDEITEISGALDTLRQLMPVAFKWKRPEAHGRSDAVSDDGTRLGFIADQVATTDLAHWVETLGVDEREADLVDTTEVLAVNIPQNEMEALVVQALLDIDTRLKALESR